MRTAGFTLAEVVVSLAVGTLAFSGVLYGYVMTTDKAEWSADSLAAQAVASQGVEQARCARWQALTSPIIDELGITNFSRVQQLQPAVASASPLWATNYISITSYSTTPPLRQIRSDCVWSLPSRRKGPRGPFTNTVISLRTPDQ